MPAVKHSNLFIPRISRRVAIALILSFLGLSLLGDTVDARSKEIQECRSKLMKYETITAIWAFNNSLLSATLIAAPIYLPIARDHLLVHKKLRRARKILDEASWDLEKFEKSSPWVKALTRDLNATYPAHFSPLEVRNEILRSGSSYFCRHLLSLEDFSIRLDLIRYELKWNSILEATAQSLGIGQEVAFRTGQDEGQERTSPTTPSTPPPGEETPRPGEEEGEENESPNTVITAKDRICSLLGIPADSSLREIRHHFRKKSLLLHPDKNPHTLVQFQELSAAMVDYLQNEITYFR